MGGNDAKCGKAFSYVAVVTAREPLLQTPTQYVYGRLYPAVGIDVPENQCAVLVGLKAAQALTGSEANSGFVAVPPSDVIILPNQTAFSKHDLGRITNAPPLPLRQAAAATRSKR